MTSPTTGEYGLNIGTLEDGRAWIGRPTQPRFADVAVNPAMVRQFVSAIQDGNPLYWDDDYAARTAGSAVAPPAMLITWITPLDWRPDGSGGPGGALSTAVPMPGDSMINVSSEIEFFDRLRVGDHLNVVEEVVAISDEKVTQVGRGHFLTIAARFRRQSGELVAEQRNVMLRFWAEATMRLEPEAYAARPVVEIADGLVVEPLTVEITRATVVMSAAATWTFFGGHTDTAYARVQGRRDIYLSTGTVNGLLDRYVALRLGPEAFLRVRKVAMRESICAGDRITFAGRVERVTDEASGRVTNRPVRLVELALAATNGDGDTCVTATVTVELPANG